MLVGDVGHGVLVHGVSGVGQGWTRHEEGLHCPLMSLVCVPTVWQHTHSLSVPRHPVTSEGLHPEPARKEPGLSGGLLHLPG